MFLRKCGCARNYEYLRDNKTQQCFKMASPTGALRFFPVDVKEIVFEWVCMIFGSGAT